MAFSGTGDNAYAFDQGGIVDAPGIHGTNTQVYAQCGGDDLPAIETGSGNDMFFGQNARHKLPLLFLCTASYDRHPRPLRAQKH